MNEFWASQATSFADGWRSSSGNSVPHKSNVRSQSTMTSKNPFHPIYSFAVLECAISVYT